MRGAAARRSAPSGEEIEIEPDEDGPLVAYVFKTLADPYTGRINLFRVYRGTLALGLAGRSTSPAARRSGSASSASRSARS